MKGKKTGGKVVGSKNTKTLQWEALGHELTSGNAERAMKIMKSADDELFMDYYIKLLEYFKPKQARTEVKQEGVIETNIYFKRDK